jgi:hypothetical protein
MKTVKFTNTSWFAQINWDKEIANDKPVKSDKGLVNRMSDALWAWTYASEYFSMTTAKDDNDRANIMRVLEYFYAKYAYYHALYYGNDYDAVESIKKYGRGEHPIAILHKEYPGLPASKLPLANIQELEKAFIEANNQRKAEDKAKDGGYDEAKSLFEAEGLKIIKPKGITSYGDRDTVCTVHDSVRYHMYLMKRSDRAEKVKEEVRDHNHVLKFYHPLVKTIYEKIKQFQDIGDVWAMEGGGMQCQVFFGNKTGYLAILYLDMKSMKVLPKDMEYTLQVNAYKNDKLFVGFDVPGVKVQTSESVYGKI